MIDNVRIKNFKALEDARLNLERFTVLVGPNASGKTSVLEALHWLYLAALRRPGAVFWGNLDPRVIRTSRGKGPVEISVAGNWRGSPGSVRLSLEPPEEPASSNAEWRYHIEGQLADQRFLNEGPLGVSHDVGFTNQRDADYARFLNTEGRALNAMLSAGLLRFERDRLAQASYSDDPVPWLRYDGDGLASVLAYMALKRPDEFQMLQTSLRQIIPSVRQIRLDRSPVFRMEQEPGVADEPRSIQRRVWGHSIEFDMEGSPNTPASFVSEGTLLMLGLLTALWTPNRPQVILLDDLDRGLHPGAMGDLIRVLRSFLDVHPEMQIVATTHSPYLVDCVNPGEVRLTTTRENGTVVVGTLLDHPEYARWKETMLPGEFWSMVGEKWLIGAREHADAHA